MEQPWFKATAMEVICQDAGVTAMSLDTDTETPPKAPSVEELGIHLSPASASVEE